VYLYGPPPGLTDPEYSRADSRPVSIQAIPAGWPPPGGISVVTYTTCRPRTSRPAARHTPAPARSAIPGNGTSVAGGGNVTPGLGAVAVSSFAVADGRGVPVPWAVAAEDVLARPAGPPPTVHPASAAATSIALASLRWVPAFTRSG
jgi:hypothetical protein